MEKRIFLKKQNFTKEALLEEIVSRVERNKMPPPHHVSVSKSSHTPLL